MKRAYALFRDGEFWGAWPTKIQAVDEWARVRPGSKHTWEMVQVLVKIPAKMEKVHKR